MEMHVLSLSLGAAVCVVNAMLFEYVRFWLEENYKKEKGM
jgi:hypothetical protein